MYFGFLRRPFVVLLTVPAGIALLVALIGFILIALEKYLLGGADYAFIQELEPGSARTLMTVIAGGAMSALTLTYSIVLVVFTLAAGNLAPRMLKRFTSDLVNQMTAGIFGGTFLYAMLTLTFVEEKFVPDIAILGAEALAFLCVMQLIYFVRHVSKSVTIDDEIASITVQLKRGLSIRDEESRRDKEMAEKEPPKDKEFTFEICAGRPGYLEALDEERLVSLARDAGAVFRLTRAKGGYILGEEVIFEATEKLDDETVGKMQEAISIRSSRSQESLVEFSINLLVEISLRALSPGVNDTFTAIAAVDSLSNALSQAAISDEARGAILRPDGEGNIRLVLIEPSMENLINQAFHPLRQAAGNNILMAICLARAYARLCGTTGKHVQKPLEEHGLLLIRELELRCHLPEDIGNVVGYLPPAIQKANKARVAKEKD